MADDFTKKVLIDIQLKSDQLKSDVVDLYNTLGTLVVQQKKLQGQSKQNTTEYVELESKIRLTKGSIRDANKEIDNSSKALNANANSIQQNRALLSLLTQQYVKLGQEQGKTASTTVAMGKQIDALTQRLKAQEAQIGQTYRNVGNYAQAILSSIPGLGQYSSLLTKASQAFNVMGNASTEAAVGVEGLAESSVLLAGAFTAVVAAGVALYEYFKQFATFSDDLSTKWETLKAQTQSLFQSLFSGDWKGLAENFQNAGLQAEVFKQDLLDLERQAETSSVAFAAQNNEIRNLMLQMRDRSKTAEQVEQDFQKIMGITQDQYNVAHKQAVQAYNDQILLITAKANLSREQNQSITLNVNEKMSVEELSKAYETAATNVYKLVAAGRIDKDALHTSDEALKAAISADGLLENRQQLAQNRQDQRLAREAQYAQKEKALQDQIKAATKEADSERVASYTRTLEFQQEAFGKELSQTDEHYRQLIFKQEQFIAKQEAIVNNPKHSPKTRALAGTAIKAAKKDIDTIGGEQYAAIEEKLKEHNKAMLAETQKAANDLSQLQIQSIQDEQDKETLSNNLDYKQKQEALTREVDLLKENSAKLLEQIKISTPAQAKILQSEYDHEQELLEIALDKKVETQEQYQQRVQDITKKFADQQQAQQDQIDILDANGKKGITGGKNNPLNTEAYAAEQKALLDNYNQEVSQKGLTEEAKLLIEKQYLDKSKDMHDQHEKEIDELEVQGATLVANTALSIIGNSQKAAADRREVDLKKSKDNELANTSLTSAQKLAIENKYRVLEGQAKVKTFKADQKLAMAKTAIAGAEAVVKALPNPLLVGIAIATTLAEEAVIASEKPPAYAKGGTFKSDGKGAVLPGYSKRDNVNAKLRSGEAVIVSEAVADPYARGMLSAINVAYGGRSFGSVNPGNGYAVGGIVTDGNNSNRYYAKPQEGTENLANTIAFSLINNFPPIYTDVKDVNNQQAILAKTVNRVNL